MTRRDAVRLAFGAAAASGGAWAYVAKEFWNEKKPSEWTDAECLELLTKSPWAKEPTTSFNAGAGVLNTRAQSSSSNRGRRGAAGAAADPSANPTVPGHFRSVVRWESALPI